MLNPSPLSLSEKAARQLAKQIVKDANNIRVKFGTTNGRRCLHVQSIGNDNRESRTIYSQWEWDEHPANFRAQRSKTESREQAAEADKEVVVTHA